MASWGLLRLGIVGEAVAAADERYVYEPVQPASVPLHLHAFHPYRLSCMRIAPRFPYS